MSFLEKPNDRAIVVALDLGVFGSASFVQGIEDLPGAIGRISASGADVIQVNLGGLRMLQRNPSLTDKPIILRIDATNIYESRNLPSVFTVGSPDSLVFADHPQVVSVVVNLLELDEDPSVQAECISLIQRVRAAMHNSAVKLMVEPLVMRRNADQHIQGNFDLEPLIALTRQAVELGADLIKVDSPSNPDDFEQLIAVASGIPVLLRGGSKTTEAVSFQRIRAAIDAGARGVVFGRNVVRHERPADFLNALRVLVHEGATVDQALAIIGGTQ